MIAVNKHDGAVVFRHILESWDAFQTHESVSMKHHHTGLAVVRYLCNNINNNDNTTLLSDNMSHIGAQNKAEIEQIKSGGAIMTVSSNRACP